MENKRANEEDEISEQGRISEPNWRERVKDLVAAGDFTAAISILEPLVTNLNSQFSSSSSSDDNLGGKRTEFGLDLAAAFNLLADHYSFQGLSLKSDEFRTRSSLIKQHALDFDLASSRDSGDAENQAVSRTIDSNGFNSNPNVSPTDDGKTENSTKASSDNTPAHDSSDDDWEALADREPSKLISVEDLPEISKLSVEEPNVQGPKRRGRGTFTYKSDVMYGDRDFCKSKIEDSEDKNLSRGSEKTDEALKCMARDMSSYLLDFLQV
ncbi:hypothetical protein EUTSA_v10013868mg [Eutrema salsugineum]|uniref:Uncharacterized protein n=1 Tax=Eutrema salsugineum TaxID=72664 RepID=V4LEN7_EUTSA|nr:hypothetical protein EUTSA_v10013868mg [Eutrema salsugineum]